VLSFNPFSCVVCHQYNENKSNLDIETMQFNPVIVEDITRDTVDCYFVILINTVPICSIWNCRNSDEKQEREKKKTLLRLNTTKLISMWEIYFNKTQTHKHTYRQPDKKSGTYKKKNTSKIVKKKLSRHVFTRVGRQRQTNIFYFRPCHYEQDTRSCMQPLSYIAI